MYGQTQAGWEPQPLGDEVACTNNDNTPILCMQRRYTILLTEWGIRHRHNGWYIQRLRGRDYTYTYIYGKGYRAGAMCCDGSIETEWTDHTHAQTDGHSCNVCTARPRLTSPQQRKLRQCPEGCPHHRPRRDSLRHCEDRGTKSLSRQGSIRDLAYPRHEPPHNTLETNTHMHAVDTPRMYHAHHIWPITGAHTRHVHARLAVRMEITRLDAVVRIARESW